MTKRGDTDARADARRKHTEAAVALQQSEARLRLMIDAVPAMITYLDTEAHFLFCNKPYLELLGKPAEEVIGHSVQEILGESTHETLRDWLGQALSGETVRYERRHTRPTGEVRDLSVTFVPHFAEDGPEGQRGAVDGFFCLTLDITDVKTLERKLAHMAGHDTLTGLPNRALYDDRLAQAVERLRRHQEPFALVYLDIDYFKQVNDTYGHAVGDEILRGFAARLRQSIRGVDMAARLGGDEFALILEGPLDNGGAALVARKIGAAMREPFDIEGRPMSITVSIGVAIAGESLASGKILEAHADASLYQAKHLGRNTFVVQDAT